MKTPKTRTQRIVETRFKSKQEEADFFFENTITQTDFLMQSLVRDPKQKDILFVVWSEQLKMFLANIFRRYERNVFPDGELKNDIERVMMIVQKFEAMKQVKFKQKSKLKFESLPKADVEELNRIMSKTRMTIGVGFQSSTNVFPNLKVFLEEWNSKTEPFQHLAIIKFIRDRLKNAPKKEASLEMRLFPVPEDIHFASGLTEERAYKQLSYGIFEYLQRFSLNKPGRPRKCKQCGEWFLFSRKDAKTCSRQCNDASYTKTLIGKIKRRDATRKYRKKLLESEG